MAMIIIYVYIFIGVLSGFAVLAWQYFYSRSGEVRGDDLFVAALIVLFWPIVLIAVGIHIIGNVFSHDRVILRRKK